MDSKTPPTKPFVFPVMKKAIEDLFTKPHISKEDIEAFQDRYWEQLVPNFSQALKLLDIHGVPRHNILWNINDRLLDAIRSNIETKCEDIDQKKCQKLWQKLIKTGMVYIHHPYMRSLIMQVAIADYISFRQVLGKMQSIKERHVSLIVDNQYLYDDAPLPVLRHIWIAHPHKFQEELNRLFTRYQQCWSEALLDALSLSITATASSTSDLIPLLYWPPRRRRRCPAMVRIVEMIGDGQTLYSKTINILREECIKAERAACEHSSSAFFGSREPPQTLEPTTPPTKRRRRLNSSESHSDDRTPEGGGTTFFTSPAFLSHPTSITPVILSTIRFDLLMSLNEAKIDRLCVPDRIHHFVWGLNACVRNRRIDQRHASGLAYRIRSQRQRARKADAAAVEEQSLDSDGEENAKRGTSAGRTKSNKTAGSSKSGIKRTNSEDKNALESDEKSSESAILERDLHMVCRDPWVVYTVCTSLIRYVINGLYDYKLPRDIPEVSLLVTFLVWAHGEDFQLRDAKSKGAIDTVQRALIGQILPAVSQLQLLAWRAHVADEIMAMSNHLWPTSHSQVASSAAMRRSSLSAGTEGRGDFDQPSPWLQKQISAASQSTSVTVPPDYISHPIGYFILQYHTLFALERGELAVVRALLKIAANVVQQQTRASRLAGRGKQGPLSPPKSPTFNLPNQFFFRWRPDVLQALVLGIARLPTSAPAFVDSSQLTSRTMNASSSNLDANSDSHPSQSSASFDRSDSKAGSTPSDDSKPMGTSGPTESRAASTILITRSELALLLKASLTLTTDVHLLALAQVAVLLPGPQTSISGPAANPLLHSSSEAAGTDSLPTATEREKCISLFSKHLALESESESESTLTTPGVYKSNNSHVLLAWETLKKGVERNTPSSTSASTSSRSSVSATPSLLSPFSSLPPTMTPNRGFQPPADPSSWSGSTPRSPNTKSSRPTFIRPPSYLLPMATPLTNPGLMGATPNVSNFGSSGNVPQTPRRPSTPPPEFRPSSPVHSNLK